MPALALVAVSIATFVAPKAHPPASPGGQAYCGAWCVFAAAHAVGRNIPVESLIRPEYIGSRQGSTLQELYRAATDHGLAAVPVAGFPVDGLRGLSGPMILHVRPEGYQTRYSHWVLFLGMDGDCARVLDPPGGVTTIPLADLAARWDGVGLLIADQPTAVARDQVASGSVFLASVAGLGVIGLAAVRFGSARLGGSRRPLLAQAALLSGVAVACAAGWHFLRPDGFARSTPAVASVRANRVRPTVARLDYAAFESLRSDPATVVVDARPAAAYAAGHIPGAINIPIDESRAQRTESVKQLADGARVVLYCQSDRCPWAEVVAGDLAARGVGPLFLYPGGYKEWRSHASPKR